MTSQVFLIVKHAVTNKVPLRPEFFLSKSTCFPKQRALVKTVLTDKTYVYTYPLGLKQKPFSVAQI